MNHNQKIEALNNEDVAIERLCADTVALVKHARNITVQQVNMIQLLTYYAIGKWIVDVQQNGESRARYGSYVIKRLSEEMQKNFERGFSEDSLKNVRKFYLTYKNRINETEFNLFAVEKSETVFSFFREKPPFMVSWSHYLQLMRIENEDERGFYEIESAKSGWSVRTLQRQYNSSLYERLALSRDKEAVLQLAKKGNIITKPEDIVKQPTVLEFLGIEEKAKYSETDLETAIIDKLQKFLLEMGKGYLFESRQKRFTFNEDSYYVDYSDSLIIPRGCKKSCVYGEKSFLIGIRYVEICCQISLLLCCRISFLIIVFPVYLFLYTYIKFFVHQSGISRKEILCGCFPHPASGIRLDISGYTANADEIRPGHF